MDSEAPSHRQDEDDLLVARCRDAYSLWCQDKVLVTLICTMVYMQNVDPYQCRIVDCTVTKGRVTGPPDRHGTCRLSPNFQWTGTSVGGRV